MYEVWCAQLDEDRGDDVGEEDNAFGDIWTDEVEGGGENDHVEDIVNEAWCIVSSELYSRIVVV